MNRILAFVALAVFAIPPIVAARVLFRTLTGAPEPGLKTGVACAAATSLIWSFMASGAVILGWGSFWLALPGAFCLLVGGFCAWRQGGLARWTQLAGVLFFAVAPGLFVSSQVESVRHHLERLRQRGPVAGPAVPAVAPR